MNKIATHKIYMFSIVIFRENAYTA